jgi:type 1 fimbria pilin
MTIKKTTVLMAAVLAVATVLAAGLVVFPGSVQEAQANPCSVDADSNANDADLDCDFEGIGSIELEE